MVNMKFIVKSMILTIIFSSMTLFMIGCSTTSNFANEDMEMSTKVISIDEFLDHMTAEGFEVVENPIVDALVTSSAYAIKGDMQIEFYKYNDVNDSRINFIDSKDELLGNINGSNEIKSFTWKNGERISVRNGGRYILILRIEDITIYLNVNSKHKKAVVEVIKGLGY